ITLPSLAAGGHTITAHYNGDGTYAESDSNRVAQSVAGSYDKALPYGIDVTKNGLKGDGVTDNTQALRNLIKSFPESVCNGCGPGGQRLYFPAGTYLFSDTIDLSRLANVMLAGELDRNGKPISILKANSIATPFVAYECNGVGGCSDPGAIP